MATVLKIFALGFAVSLCGDAAHVASGTTVYDWDGVPAIWRSAIWFPFAVGGAVLAAAWASERFAPPAVRRRSAADAVVAAGAVLALYALTAALRGEPATVSVVLTAGIAVAVWAWWDPSPRAFATAAAAAVLGPLGEAAIMAVGAAHYAPDSDDLIGVAPWLPCLYFAAGAVASGLWGALSAAPASRPS
ncbi:MAG: hypothetical protein ACJ762_16135 [Solirubrobacteraceae bacterium]